MEMKRCRYCHIEKPAGTFGQAATIKGRLYRRWRCGDCKNKLQTHRLQSVRVWLEEYKKVHPCQRCGIADYRVLTFHHNDKADKQRAIADMVRHGRSLVAIKIEMAKCIVLCANCHFIEHYHEPSIQQDTGV